MAAHGLAGPLGHRIEICHCQACGLSWFDPLDFSALGREAWVGLLRLLATSPRNAPTSPPTLGEGTCPRCSRPLVARAEQTQFGRYTSHACPQGHGHAQRASALLSSRGLFRPLQLAERVALATERRQLDCLTCGAAMDGGAEHCSFCRSPATVLDIPRLSIALGLIDEAALDRIRPRSADVDAPVQTWACRGCGHPLDPTRQARCAQCAHPVLVPALSDLLPLLIAAEARLLKLAQANGASALSGLPAVQRRRIAELTQRPEHAEALDRLDGLFWRRWAVLMGVGAAAALWLWSLL